METSVVTNKRKSNPYKDGSLNHGMYNFVEDNKINQPLINHDIQSYCNRQGRVVHLINLPQIASQQDRLAQSFNLIFVSHHLTIDRFFYMKKGVVSDFMQPSHYTAEYKKQSVNGDETWIAHVYYNLRGLITAYQLKRTVPSGQTEIIPLDKAIKATLITQAEPAVQLLNKLIDLRAQSLMELYTRSFKLDDELSCLSQYGHNHTEMSGIINEFNDTIATINRYKDKGMQDGRQIYMPLISAVNRVDTPRVINDAKVSLVDQPESGSKIKAYALKKQTKNQKKAVEKLTRVAERQLAIKTRLTELYEEIDNIKQTQRSKLAVIRIIQPHLREIESLLIENTDKSFKIKQNKLERYGAKKLSDYFIDSIHKGDMETVKSLYDEVAPNINLIPHFLHLIFCIKECKDKVLLKKLIDIADFFNMISDIYRATFRVKSQYVYQSKENQGINDLYLLISYDNMPGLDMFLRHGCSYQYILQCGRRVIFPLWFLLQGGFPERSIEQNKELIRILFLHNVTTIYRDTRPLDNNEVREKFIQEVQELEQHKRANDYSNLSVIHTPVLNDEMVIKLNEINHYLLVALQYESDLIPHLIPYAADDDLWVLFFSISYLLNKSSIQSPFMTTKGNITDIYKKYDFLGYYDNDSSLDAVEDTINTISQQIKTILEVADPGILRTIMTKLKIQGEMHEGEAHPLTLIRSYDGNQCVNRILKMSSKEIETLQNENNHMAVLIYGEQDKTYRLFGNNQGASEANYGLKNAHPLTVFNNKPNNWGVTTLNKLPPTVKETLQSVFLSMTRDNDQLLSCSSEYRVLYKTINLQKAHVSLQINYQNALVAYHAAQIVYNLIEDPNLTDNETMLELFCCYERVKAKLITENSSMPYSKKTGYYWANQFILDLDPTAIEELKSRPIYGYIREQFAKESSGNDGLLSRNSIFNLQECKQEQNKNNPPEQANLVL